MRQIRIETNSISHFNDDQQNKNIRDYAFDLKVVRKKANRSFLINRTYKNHIRTKNNFVNE